MAIESHLRPQSIRVGRNFMLSDFLYSEAAAKRSSVWHGAINLEAIVASGSTPMVYRERSIKPCLRHTSSPDEIGISTAVPAKIKAVPPASTSGDAIAIKPRLNQIFITLL